MPDAPAACAGWVRRGAVGGGGWGVEMSEGEWCGGGGGRETGGGSIVVGFAAEVTAGDIKGDHDRGWTGGVLGTAMGVGTYSIYSLIVLPYLTPWPALQMSRVVRRRSVVTGARRLPLGVNPLLARQPLRDLIRLLQVSQITLDPVRLAGVAVLLQLLDRFLGVLIFLRQQEDLEGGR